MRRVVVSNSQRFGAYFFLSASILILAFMIYTQIFVVRPARLMARHMIELYAFSYKLAMVDTVVVAESDSDIQIIFETIRQSDFPVVITDGEGNPQVWKNIGISPELRTPEAIQGVREMARTLDLANPPLPMEMPYIGDRLLHYGDSTLLDRLSWLPVVALLATGLFVGIGYSGFRHIKNSEQRSIWVGMARETAHQLGTPLSSLAGWNELLKGEIERVASTDSEDLEERLTQLVREMENDTSRLTKIASRFSQIGSTPELRVGNLDEVIGETASYLRNRLPSDVTLEYAPGAMPPLPINRELLGWAFENLFKNAADALEGRQPGWIRVSTKVREEGQWVDVTVEDNGKGIQPHAIKQVFLPGYSTKKRGWGLGLSFVKRIVEDYHKGKIEVLDSAPGRGTTFQISLPIR
jgi:two-component system, NtrC family, sensor histidine kinase KinB